MNLHQSFFELTPESVLDSVEAALGGENSGKRTTGRSIALNSLENRVYELELEDETKIVAKFYRPGRWSKEQILEEHNFLFALQKAEIPVVATLPLQTGSLAQTKDGIYFTIFPKVRGRLQDELNDEQLRTVGRYIARIHSVGASFPFRHRLKLNVENLATKPLEFLLESRSIDLAAENKYKKAVARILQLIEPLFRNTQYLSTHGDCHLGNTLWQGESPFFLDFDDAMLAPPVQDIWMIIRGRDEEAIQQRLTILEAYETMRDFDYKTLQLIEPLRALRVIHYSAWIAKRWNDPAFPKAFPNFKSGRYWEEEVQELEEIIRILEHKDQ